MADAKVLVHPWQDRGVGKAPFRCVGMVQLPSPGLAEANPTAYAMALSECAKIAEKYGVSCGTCNVCGIDIMNNCVIEGGDGKRFVCGIDCVRKSGGAKLVTQAEALERERQRVLRAAKREAERIARNAMYEAEIAAQRVRNGGKSDAELRAEKEAEERKAKADAQSRRSKWLWEVLIASGTNFGANVGHELRLGVRSIDDLSRNCLSVCREVYAKAASRNARRGAQAYTEAENQFDLKLIETGGL